jgi:hypothetical protein
MKKRPVGRPKIADSKKAKPISKMIRVPLSIADELKALATMHKAGQIDASDIQKLIDSNSGGNSGKTK